MKARPRNSENRIAEELNKNWPLATRMERIPVLGRTGPDLTINELGLVVDAKSRKSCPKKYFPKSKEVLTDGTFWVCRVNEFAASETFSVQKIKPSVMVKRWMDHIKEWTEDQKDESLICAVVMHRSNHGRKGPLMPFGNSALVLYHIDKEIFHDRAKCYRAD